MPAIPCAFRSVAAVIWVAHWLSNVNETTVGLAAGSAATGAGAFGSAARAAAAASAAASAASCLATLVAVWEVAVVGGFGVSREAPGAAGPVAADAGTADMPAATNAAK